MIVYECFIVSKKTTSVWVTHESKKLMDTALEANKVNQT